MINSKNNNDFMNEGIVPEEIIPLENLAEIINNSEVEDLKGILTHLKNYLKVSLEESNASEAYNYKLCCIIVEEKIRKKKSQK